MNTKNETKSADHDMARVEAGSAQDPVRQKTAAATGAPAQDGFGAHRSVRCVPATIHVAPANVGEGKVMLSGQTARALGLKDGASINVKAGFRRGAGNILITESMKSVPNNTVFVSETLLAHLCVTAPVKLHVRYDAEASTLFFGPFVGILALRTRSGPLFGELDPFFRALIRQGARLAIPAFMFTPSGVNLKTKQIFGYTYSPLSGGFRWHRQKYPLPDVVYDRIQTRRAEMRPQYARFRADLAKDVGYWFNEPGFFDKWRFHQLLKDDEVIGPLLPETLRYKGRADLENMLNTFSTVYLKPVGGSLGLGIIKVRRSGPRFTITYEPGEKVVMRKATSLTRLERIINRLIRERSYIVQQGLPLARWNGRPFDIRMLMQRSAGGQWFVTKIFSRIARPGSITSNLSRGADACNIHLLLGRVFGRRNKGRLLRQLHGVGLQCAERIESSLPGTIGELGLDLGISRNGRIWLIEANSKPFLQMTRESGSVQTLTLSVRRPLLFAKFLTGFE